MTAENTPRTDALKPDKERLDWILTPTGSTVCYGHLRDNFTLTRAAIAARKDDNK